MNPVSYELIEGSELLPFESSDSEAEEAESAPGPPRRRMSYMPSSVPEPENVSGALKKDPMLFFLDEHQEDCPSG